MSTYHKKPINIRTNPRPCEVDGRLGQFHRWFEYWGVLQMEMRALVELNDGTVVTPLASKVKFINDEAPALEPSRTEPGEKELTQTTTPTAEVLLYNLQCALEQYEQRQGHRAAGVLVSVDTADAMQREGSRELSYIRGRTSNRFLGYEVFYTLRPGILAVIGQSIHNQS